jgi:hypothetical protein
VGGEICVTVCEGESIFELVRNGVLGSLNEEAVQSGTEASSIPLHFPYGEVFSGCGSIALPLFTKSSIGFI